MVVQKFVSRLKSELSFVRGNLLVLIVSWALMSFAFTMAHPFESPYITELGASPFIIGLMGSLGAAILCVVNIPGAYIADKYGRRLIIVTMTYGMALSYLFYALAPSWHFILIGVIVHNACLIYSPALHAILADSIPPDKRGVGFATAYTIPGIASIASPAIAGFMVGWHGLVNGMRIVFSATVLACLAAATIRTLFLKETLDVPKKIKLGGLKSIFSESISSIVGAWKLMPRSLVFLTLARLISAFEEPMFRHFASLYVMYVIGIRGPEWGLISTAFILASMIAGVPIGKLVDVVGRRRSMMLAYSLFIPSSVAFILSRTPIELLTVFILFALGHAFILPAYAALETDMVPRDKRGRIMGTIGILNLLATIPSASIGGFLYEANPAAPFIMAVALGALAFLVVALFVKEPQRREV